MSEILIPKNCKHLSATAEVLNDGGDARCEVEQILNEKTLLTTLHFKFYNITGADGQDATFDSADIDANIADAKRRAEELEVEYKKKLKAECDKIYADKDRQVALLEGELASSSEQVKQLLCEIEAVDAEKAAVESSLSESQDALAQTRSQLAASEQLVSQKTEQITGLNITVGALQTRVTELERQSSDKDAEIAELECALEENNKDAEVARLNNALAALTLQAVEKDAEIARLRGQVDSMSSSDESAQKLAQLSDEVSRLQASLSAMAQEVARLSAENEELKKGGATVTPPVTEPEPLPTSVTVEWDFAGTLNGNEATAFQLQFGEGEVTSAVDEVSGAKAVMKVHATDGKLAARRDNADTQINALTRLEVPVTDGAAVTITKKSGTFTINGTECDEYVHEGDAGYAVIECTANGYITKITVSNLDWSLVSEMEEPEPEVPVTPPAQAENAAVWDFAGTLNGSADTQIQGRSGTVGASISGVDGSSVVMSVDATAGKLAARAANADTQINAGTKLTVPVTDGAVIKITKLAGTFTINGTECDEYAYSGVKGEVEVCCTANGYITGITVAPLDWEQLKPEEPAVIIDEPQEAGGDYESLEDGTAEGRASVTAPAEPGTITLYKNSEVQEECPQTLGEVFDLIKAGAGDDEWRIELSPGTYPAKSLNYKGLEKIDIIGTGSAEYGTDVLIEGQGSDMTQMATRSILSFEGSPRVTVRNVAFRHTYAQTAGNAQAETIGVGRSAFTGTIACHNCAFLSGQDTICTMGKAWFYRCYVEGDTDFLWIEAKSGKVALYEECVLRMVAGRTASGYFAAPRLAVANTVAKGLVIWKSVLQVEDGMKAYLARNPWGDGTPYFNDYYENVAVVGTRLQANEPLAAEVWKYGAHGTDNQQFVGFKTDAYFPKSSKQQENGSRRLTQEQVAAEYGNRMVILNRLYNIAKEKFVNDDDVWDVRFAAEDFGAGESGSLPAVEVDLTCVKAEWNFAGTLNGSTVAQYQKNSGKIATDIDGVSDSEINMSVDATAGKLAAREACGDTQCNAGTVLTVPVTDGATVEVAKLAGDFTINGQAGNVYTHKGEAQKAEIRCTANAYITKVTVDGLDFTQLTPSLRGVKW